MKQEFDAIVKKLIDGEITVDEFAHIATAQITTASPEELAKLIEAMGDPLVAKPKLKILKGGE